MWGLGEKGRVWLQAAQSPCPTGFVKHTPDKRRAPAYSFHGAPTLLAENCSPGPRYSVNPKILRTGKDIGPAYSILGRYCTKTTLTPGPGDGLWPSPSPAPAWTAREPLWVRTPDLGWPPQERMRLTPSSACWSTPALACSAVLTQQAPVATGLCPGHPLFSTPAPVSLALPPLAR